MNKAVIIKTIRQKQFELYNKMAEQIKLLPSRQKRNTISDTDRNKMKWGRESYEGEIKKKKKKKRNARSPCGLCASDVLFVFSREADNHFLTASLYHLTGYG